MAGFTTLATVAIAGATLAAGAYAMKKSTPTMPPMPEPPKDVVADSVAKDVAKRRKASATQTTHTSPLGISGEADIGRKTLLGQ
jgi:hypothetical protein